MPRILGIDPGIRRTGYGLIDTEGSRFVWVAAGVIAPDEAADLPERLLCIHRELGAVLALHRPDACAFENVYYHKNPRSMLTLGQAQAAAILATAGRDLAPAFYSPSEIKQALTGSGRAAKEQVRFMVERILGRPLGSEPDDLSDALAVAICHAGRSRETVLP
jgi:crossover junction endodeoxyribonuclease RuvC